MDNKRPEGCYAMTILNISIEGWLIMLIIVMLALVLGKNS